MLLDLPDRGDRDALLRVHERVVRGAPITPIAAGRWRVTVARQRPGSAAEPYCFEA
jgi:hypothetical protein